MIASTLRQRQGRVMWSMMLQSMRCAAQEGVAAKLGDDRRALDDALSVGRLDGCEGHGVVRGGERRVAAVAIAGFVLGQFAVWPGRSRRRGSVGSGARHPAGGVEGAQNYLGNIREIS